MTSGSGTDRQIGSSRSLPVLQQQSDGQRTRHGSANLNRPLPSLPPSATAQPSMSYEIPSLRSRADRKPSNTSQEKSSRFVGNSLQGMFGGRRDPKHEYMQDGNSDSSSNDRQTRARFTQLKSAVSGSRINVATEPQSATGSCMTCGSTVRWPRDLKIFRCTTCSTVNDLEPFLELESPRDQTIPNRKAITISLDRTKKLVHQCLDRYLHQQIEQVCSQHLAEPNRSATTGTQTSTPQPPEADHQGSETWLQSVSVKSHDLSSSHAGLSHTPTNVNHKPPSNPTLPRATNDTRTGHDNVRNQAPAATAIGHSKHPVSNTIFRDLESYISSCFSGCTALNASFFSVKSAATELDRPVGSKRTMPRAAETATTPQMEADGSISELDAKTLLLGDVAENGSWWTGRTASKESQAQSKRERSPERWRGIVSAKTPRVNWHELGEWYRVILHAGDDWQIRWRQLDGIHDSLTPLQSNTRLTSHIQLAVNESQLHLRRVLLKSTENLLKRPRRPLKSPEDCRFLLMLLANPSLNSSSQRIAQANEDPVRSKSGHSRGVSDANILSSKRGVGLGQHTGIVKRILGLVSNLPNDVHQFLVSWMSRFSDSHVQRLVDLISSFVTYRLSKQQDRSVADAINPTEGLVPSMADTGESHASQLHAAIGHQSSNRSKTKKESKPKLGIYSEDWQVRAAARFMSLLFQANTGHTTRKRELSISQEQRLQSAGLNAKYHAYSHGQILPISTFYNTMLDHADLIGDFEAWETTKTKFTFCQYPFFLSIWAKIHIMEHDARRQMEVKAREAFFDSILSRRAVSQFLVLKVRRDCLVDDSLRSVSQIVGSGGSDIKKGLRIDFVDEEGVDAGGLRKEWFLLLVREIFDPQHGLFLYDDDSHYCYFNPFCFESSEQFFLVGVLLGLAIYNSTILDIAFPPFVFKKMLASAPMTGDKLTSTPKITHTCTLEDLAEYRPALAKGLRQLLEFEGDVQETFCRDFVVEMEKYGEIVQIPLRPNGERKPVTNSNRREFVDLYVRYLLDTAVARQYEPFKRGFFSVCGGNALSLFQPEEIELLVRGSDEHLDIASLRAVAIYDNWPKGTEPPDQQPQVLWFWQTFEQANPSKQRRLLGFITGSDRIPAMGTTNLTIRVQCIRDQEAEENGVEIQRFPIARTCFNTINLPRYLRKETLETKLWMAVAESEGFGLK